MNYFSLHSEIICIKITLSYQIIYSLIVLGPTWKIKVKQSNVLSSRVVWSNGGDRSLIMSADLQYKSLVQLMYIGMSLPKKKINSHVVLGNESLRPNASQIESLTPSLTIEHGIDSEFSCLNIYATFNACDILSSLNVFPLL